MTGLEILTAAWTQTGKPSTLDPSNATALATLVLAFNYEINSVIGWKKGSRQLRLRWYETEEYKKYATYTGTVASVDSTETVITLSSVVGFPTVLSEAVVEDSTGELRYVYAYASGTPSVSINEAFTTTPVAADTFTIYPVQFDLSVDRFVEVLRVESINDQSELSRMLPKESRLGSILTLGNPGFYQRRGKAIWLDTPPDDSDYILKITYQRMPETWVVADDPTGASIDIPDSYHGALVYRFIWWFYLQQNEPEKALNALNNFNSYMTSLRTPDDYVHSMTHNRPSEVRAV